MQTDVTELEELSTETTFITEDMLQSISTGSRNPVSNGNLNDSSSSSERCRFVFGSNASLRDDLVAQQHSTNCLGNREQFDSVTNANVLVANDNQVLDMCIHGNPATNSNRSSIESNHSNNMFYELQSLHEGQCNQSQAHDTTRDSQNIINQNSAATTADDQSQTTTRIYENVPIVLGNQRTIEVRGVTNTSSSDSYIKCSHGDRESDISLPGDLSGAAIETESSITDNSGAAGGNAENNQVVSDPPAELSDILFRFDRQFRGNRGFGFNNWRWPHRISNQSSSSGGGATAASPENTLQKHARWLRRLHVHQSTATPTNSNSNSLRSNSSGSSSGVRGGNLQQEWYFYDPRLVPQHRTQRLAVQTDHNRIHTTSYVSNIIGPPTYEELANLPVNGQHCEATSCVLPNLPEDPPPFEDMQIVPSDSGALPTEPPPPYVDTELPPVYDLDPSSLIDPPPLYDDHSFSDEDLPLDPMDPNPISQGQDDNFILTQATTVPSETDGNFILSAVPHLRSVNRQDVSIIPDNQSIASENDSDVTASDSDVMSTEHFEDGNVNGLPGIETELCGIGNINGEEEVSRHRPLPLEELFRDPNISDGERNSDDLDIEQITDVSDLSNDDSDDQLPGQSARNASSSIFPGYQLLHNSPELPPWSRLGHITNLLTNEADDNLDDVTDDLVDDLPDQYEDNSRSLANFPSDDYPAGFVSGSRPPLRWSRGMGLGRWNAQNWAI